jgi:hypothetical protein
MIRLLLVANTNTNIIQSLIKYLLVFAESHHKILHDYILNFYKIVFREPL